MHVVKDGYPDGIIGWMDVTTADMAGTMAFYSGLFGWEIEELDDGAGNVIYRQALLDGLRVVGLADNFPDAPKGTPSTWTPYVIHSDADGVLARAEAAGGTVIFPAMDVYESGRMAILKDSTGATIGVWQPNLHTGAQVINSVNTLVWNELIASDLRKAAEFYSFVFGWEAAQDPDYVKFQIGGRTHAGAASMVSADESMWLNFFLVADADATVSRALELGGTMSPGSYDRSEWGARAVLYDPQGGVFGIYESAEPAPAPPSK